MRYKALCWNHQILISNFAFKGIIGVVAIVYIGLFGLSFWQISSLNNKIVGYDQVLQSHQLKNAELKKPNFLSLG